MRMGGTMRSAIYTEAPSGETTKCYIRSLDVTSLANAAIMTGAVDRDRSHLYAISLVAANGTL